MRHPAMSLRSSGLPLLRLPLRPRIASEISRPQVRPSLSGKPLGLRASPCRDVGVIAAGEHLGDCDALPELGARELRIFKKPLSEALLLPRGLAAHHSGEQPYAGIEERKGCYLPA